MRFASFFAAAGCGLAALFASSFAHAQDPLAEAIARVGYWHMHVTSTVLNKGTTHIDRTFDQCLDLRKPTPPVNKLPGWACPDLNVQKTPTTYRAGAACTFNTGSLTSTINVSLGRDRSSVLFHQELYWNWTNPDRTPAQSHIVFDGRLSGECPPGMPISNQAGANAANGQLRLNPAEDAIIRHNR